MNANIAADLQPLAVPLDRMKADPRNARAHPDRNLAAVMSSLEKFGQRKPIVCNRRTNIVLAGNGLVKAARALGWDSVAAVWVDDDDATAAAFGIADNRTAELATWDDAMLAELLQELQADSDYSLSDLGFDETEYRRLVATIDEPEPDFVPTGADDQHRLDKLQPLLCPHCGLDTRKPPEAPAA
jgi:ParB-like chromosome segregation protein Spo0J